MEWFKFLARIFLDFDLSIDFDMVECEGCLISSRTCVCCVYFIRNRCSFFHNFHYDFEG